MLAAISAHSDTTSFLPFILLHFAFVQYLLVAHGKYHTSAFFGRDIGSFQPISGLVTLCVPDGFLYFFCQSRRAYYLQENMERVQL